MPTTIDWRIDPITPPTRYIMVTAVGMVACITAIADSGSAEEDYRSGLLAEARSHLRRMGWFTLPPGTAVAWRLPTFPVIDDCGLDSALSLMLGLPENNHRAAA